MQYILYISYIFCYIFHVLKINTLKKHLLNASSVDDMLRSVWSGRDFCSCHQFTTANLIAPIHSPLSHPRVNNELVEAEGGGGENHPFISLQGWLFVR